MKPSFTLQSFISNILVKSTYVKGKHRLFRGLTTPEFQILSFYYSSNIYKFTIDVLSALEVSVPQLTISGFLEFTTLGTAL